MKYAAQLYNFRDVMPGDMRGKLRKIADLGFDGVEFAGIVNWQNFDELFDMTSASGLECAGFMFSQERLANPDDPVYPYAKKFKTPAVTFSCSRDFVAERKSFIESCRAVGRAAAKHGLVLAYHNHWKEFARIDGTPVLDLMCAKTDPENVFLEPDICWLTRGGGDPAEYIRRYGKRIRQVHFKDIRVIDDPDTTVPLGDGIIRLEEAFCAAVESGAEWAIYEQDTTSDPFADAEKSLEYLRRCGEKYNGK